MPSILERLLCASYLLVTSTASMQQYPLAMYYMSGICTGIGKSAVIMWQSSQGQLTCVGVAIAATVL
jgi:hypothetical protein